MNFFMSAHTCLYVCICIQMCIHYDYVAFVSTTFTLAFSHFLHSSHAFVLCCQLVVKFSTCAQWRHKYAINIEKNCDSICMYIWVCLGVSLIHLNAWTFIYIAAAAVARAFVGEAFLFCARFECGPLNCWICRSI